MTQTSSMRLKNMRRWYNSKCLTIVTEPISRELVTYPRLIRIFHITMSFFFLTYVSRSNHPSAPPFCLGIPCCSMTRRVELAWVRCVLCGNVHNDMRHSRTESWWIVFRRSEMAKHTAKNLGFCVRAWESLRGYDTNVVDAVEEHKKMVQQQVPNDCY